MGDFFSSTLDLCLTVIISLDLVGNSDQIVLRFQEPLFYIENNMPLQIIPIYRIQAGIEQPDRTCFLRELYRTSEQPVFEQVCRQISELVKPLPKVRNIRGGSSRSITVFKLVDQTEATKCRMSGAVSETVEAGWIFPTIELAAEALGYAVGTLTMMLYRARKASGTGIDQDIVVRGWLVGYTDKSRSYRKAERNVP